ncbi:uncharacterized protein LOC144124752 [Amblyomma americanum]
MKHVLATICALGFVAFTATAYTLPEEEPALDAVLDSQVKAAAEEAIIVGKMLIDVAQQLEDEADFEAEDDEYFIKGLWEKTKAAMKNATSKFKTAVKDAYKDAKSHVKATAKEAKNKISDKVTEILSKILGKLGQSYSLEDSVSRVDIVKDVCANIARVGQRLVEQGQSLLEN